MKKKILLLLLALVLCAASIFGIYRTVQNNRAAHFTFSIPEDTKYVLVNSSGRDSKEISIVHYLDQDGKLIEQRTVDKIACPSCIEQDPLTQERNFFTHESIYFEDGSILANEEMENLYHFSSDHGLDAVYYSGYVEQLGLFCKQIPHGLAYKISEYGTFDLLVLYNKDHLYNLRIRPNGCIAVDQETGVIYNFNADTENHILCDKIVFDVESGNSTQTETVLSLEEFFSKNSDIESLCYVSKPLILGSSIYLLADFEMKQEEESTDIVGKIPHFYLLEFQLDRTADKMEYLDAYPIAFEEGYLGDSTPTTYTDGTIAYYSTIVPSMILTFDTNTKELNRYPFLDSTTDPYSDPFVVYVGKEDVYLFRMDPEQEQYSIYKVLPDFTFEHIVDGDLPSTHTLTTTWITNFYVIEK